MTRETELIDLLLKQGVVTKEQLKKADDEVERTGLSLPKALEKLGFIKEEDIANVRAGALGVPFMDLKDYIIDAELTKVIPESFARKYKVVPLFKIGDVLTVAMADPRNIIVLDEIRKVSKIDAIDTVLATEGGIQKILDTYYALAGSVDEIVEFLDREKFAIGEEADLAEVAEEAPIIKLVNLMVVQAVKDRASDIHIEPEENSLRVRNRIDGVLYEAYSLPKRLHRAVVSRVKILSDLDIAESRRPQDGRIRLRLENKSLDIRVSTFPTVHGENVVMRLLDKSSVLLGLKELGFSEEKLAIFDKLIRYPNGIILVTGPTGSGKTTTLYAALTTINSMEKNIITIEDPVEYELPLIRQTQVNPKAGITFANGLRSIVRQDPDVIMVGEVRDKETADIAIRAALTGHLVFSTLHTNDAPSSLTRLIDMGVEQFLISSSVIGIVAQRLVRVLCDKCKEEYEPPREVLEDLALEKKVKFYRAKGCDDCKQMGFMGRTAIFELLVINEEIRKLINEKASADQIRQKAIELGMATLREDGIEKAAAGITMPEEVIRATKIE